MVAIGACLFRGLQIQGWERWSGSAIDTPLLTPG